MWSPRRTYVRPVSRYRHRRTVERDPVSRSKRGFVGRMPSYRSDPGLVPFESLLERDQAILLEVDPTVASIWAQPLRLDVHFEGELYRPIPDFLAEYHDGGIVLWEVRAAGAVISADPAEQARVDAWYEAVRAEAARRGYDHRLVTERDIRVQPRLDNARHVLRGTGDVVDVRALSAVRLVVQVLPDPLTIGKVRDAVGRDVDTAFWAIMRLIYLGELAADMTVPFGDRTRLRRR